MKRLYYLGLNAGGPKASECLFTHGSSRDLRSLNEFLAGKYQGASILTKNGRSALALALKSYFDPGDKVIVCGFTCYAVYEAVTAAEMTPIFADINPENLNFDMGTLEKAMSSEHAIRVKGIIIQNTLGNPVNIKEIEKFAKKHELLIIEDLAHSAGVKYPDGREAGTVGVATALSFGKDKAINTISGGAVILREPAKNQVEAPFRLPRFRDYMRARLYPLFCTMCRGLNHIHLGGGLMRCLINIHLVEKSADNKLDLERRICKYQARMALLKLKKLKNIGVIREFYFVKEREKVLEKLREAGYFFDSFWYEKPVSPKRYYKKVGFDEKECPVAVEISKIIINFPIYYSKKDLAKAHKIIEPYLVGGKNE